MNDYNDLADLRAADQALLDAVCEANGQPYKAPKGIPSKWNGYQKCTYPQVKLSPRFRDDGTGKPEKVTRAPTGRPQTTAKQRQERRERAQAMHAQGATVQQIAAELGISQQTAQIYLQIGAWGKLG